jgi:hypothetical protein
MEMAEPARYDGRHDDMTFNLEGVRRDRLYHTLPDEIGHWADMYENVKLPSRNDDHESWE